MSLPAYLRDRDAKRRGILFALSGTSALFFGFFAVAPIPAGHLIIAWGYYYILGVFALFVFYAWRLAQARREVWREWVRRPGAAGALIGAGTAFAVWSDTFRHKILYDEFVIQGTAFYMHATKQVSTVVRAYNIGGTWLPIDPFLDKRPYFFPFLVSLLHDLTGYRIANMFALNVALAAVLLGLLYWFTRQLAGRGPALFAAAAMAILPLFGQNATGAGMDLHNLTMISLVACLGLLYLRVPSDDRLSLFVLGMVLLAESRYESVIFIVPVAFLVVAGWQRAGRVILPWPALVAPLLLIPYAWHGRVFAATPIFFQLQEGQTSAFGTANIADNLAGDIAFLFNTGPGLANSWYLSGLGVAGLCWALFCGWRWARSRPRPQLEPAVVAALAFGAGIAGHFVVLLFYWWAKFNDLMASRFSLPMCLAFAVLAAVLVKGLAARRVPALGAAWVGLGVWFLAAGVPEIALRFSSSTNIGMQQLEWERSVIASRPGPVLFVSNKSTIPFILWRTETILNSIAAMKVNDIRYHLGQETFKEVIVSQGMRPTTAEGDMGVTPEDALPANFHLKTIAERRFGPWVERLSTVVEIDPAPEKDPKDLQRPAVPSALRTISAVQSLIEPPVAALTSSALSR